MRYRNAIAFRQALEDRLKAEAVDNPTQIARDRKRIAFDRLLARLASVAPGRWLLKGGFALDLRLGEQARVTKDVDIEWLAASGELLGVLIEVAEFDADDFFSFTIERAGTPGDRFGGSHRFHVSASLAARHFESFALDVGIQGDARLEPQTLSTDGLLAFAGIPPVQVQAVPIEIQITEKLHAYTRSYEGERTSTRVKDLVDLALIARHASVDAVAVRTALAGTFTDRDTHPVPAALPTPPAGWAAPFRILAETVGVPGDLGAGHQLAAAMLDPVLNGDIADGTWDSTRSRWAS